MASEMINEEKMADARLDTARSRHAIQHRVPFRFGDVVEKVEGDNVRELFVVARGALSTRPQVNCLSLTTSTPSLTPLPTAADVLESMSPAEEELWTIQAALWRLDSQGSLTNDVAAKTLYQLVRLTFPPSPHRFRR